LQNIVLTSSLVFHVWGYINFWAQRIKVLEWIFWSLCTNEFLQLSNVFFFGLWLSISLMWNINIVMVSLIHIIHFILIHLLFQSPHSWFFLLLKLGLNLRCSLTSTVLCRSIILSLICNHVWPVMVWGQHFLEGPCNIFLHILRLFNRTKLLELG